jgi:hypothetical protein
MLGTAGQGGATNAAPSPLFQIDKALNALLPAAEDPSEFGEAMDEFVSRLRQVRAHTQKPTLHLRGCYARHALSARGQRPLSVCARAGAC